MGTKSTVIPRYTTTNFGIRVIPVNRALIAGVHAGAALNAVFNLKMHRAVLVHGITVSRAHVGRTLVRTGGIANIRVHDNVWFNFRLRLIAIADQPQAFGKFK